MEFDILNVLYKDVKSAEVREAIKKHSLSEIRKSPTKHYQGSRKNGLDLVIADDCVVAVQIFVQADDPYAAFTGTLPLGIGAGMTQQQVERLVGKPKRSSQYSSQFELPKLKAVLTVEYDDGSVVKFLNIGRPR